MARGSGLSDDEASRLICMLLMIPTVICGVYAVVCIVALVLFLTRDDDQVERVVFFAITWAILGVSVIVAVIVGIYNCIDCWREEQAHREHARMLQEQAARRAERQREWAQNRAQHMRVGLDAPDPNEEVLRAARPQVAANLADHAGEDGHAFREDDPNRQRAVADQNRRMPFLPTSARIWRLFFDQVFEIGARFIGRGMVPPADLAEVSPWVALGLPGAVVAELAVRSVTAGYPNGITLVSGERITASSRPLFGPGAHLWGPQMELQASMAISNLDEAARAYFVSLCFFGGDPTVAGRDRPVGLDVESARHAEIMHLVGLVLRLGHQISQLETFTAHFVPTVTALALLENNYEAAAPSDGGAVSAKSSSSSST